MQMIDGCDHLGFTLSRDDATYEKASLWFDSVVPDLSLKEATLTSQSQQQAQRKP